MANENSEAFYKKLKKQLKATSTWPAPYLYKFIVHTDQEKIDSLLALFDNIGAIVETRPSKGGKYTSLSIRVRMKNPDAVIIKYKQVAKLEGVIML